MIVAALRASAYEVAAGVVDPELPMLTLADLGVLRSVVESADGGVVVEVTPTYTGCPALDAMHDDLVRVLRGAGYGPVEVRVSLSPPWSSDMITERGRALLREHRVSPPGPAPAGDGPVPLSLAPTRRVLTCPACGAEDARLTSEFGPTACTALYVCAACGEPFQHVKEI